MEFQKAEIPTTENRLKVIAEGDFLDGGEKMGKDGKVVKIFTLEQQFPCGPKSSCCGPIGQSEEEVTSLKNAIEKLNVKVEVYDVQKLKDLQEHPQVFKLFRTFGPKAIPVITVDSEVACMGQAQTAEVISAIKAKL